MQNFPPHFACRQSLKYFFVFRFAAKTEGAPEPMDEDEDDEDGDGGSSVSKKDPAVRRSELLSKSGLAKVRS